MTTTYYKGKIGKEDISFGTGSFTRKDQDAANASKTQLNVSHIPRKVVTRTASLVIDKNIYVGETTFTNEGATTTITFTLPPAIAGMGPYKFTVIDAYEIDVDPNGTEYFRDCAAGKYKYSDVPGNNLVIWCDVNGIWEWLANVVNENWTNET